ncbi:UDP-glucose 4-epimerase GalE [Desulfurella sp.]|uniref:UDP-glucose 4-epimerase GalE n=1 Tax=Desulfurella sp. TaxID=1962857 RepID=UPI0025C62FBF|nr:UDP-glucose 4-epimerase GalE [Desulfurella sp.]
MSTKRKNNESSSYWRCWLYLKNEGIDTLTFDNLSTGHKWALLGEKLFVGDLADIEAINKAIVYFKPDAVIHFAASIQVGESVVNPLLYYSNNVKNTINLLNAMIKNNVNKIVFSSSAAVYGTPKENNPVKETYQTLPINPYGQTKLMIEKILSDMAFANQIEYIALRYFNAAGADKDAQIGQAYKFATHLITRALKTAKGEFEKLEIYGTDYPTPDGTCIRDYIHVDDLAFAHLLSLKALFNNIKNEAFNVGYSNGYSVKEVINKVKEVTKIDFKVVTAKRREGDPAYLVASNNKIKELLKWQPKYNNLEYIIQTAWEWEKKLNHYGA